MANTKNKRAKLARGQLQDVVRAHPYERMRKAFERRTGMNLSADDVQRLMLGDTAIYDAVMETWVEP